MRLIHFMSRLILISSIIVKPGARFANRFWECFFLDVVRILNGNILARGEWLTLSSKCALRISTNTSQTWNRLKIWSTRVTEELLSHTLQFVATISSTWYWTYGQTSWPQIFCNIKANHWEFSLSLQLIPAYITTIYRYKHLNTCTPFSWVHSGVCPFQKIGISCVLSNQHLCQQSAIPWLLVWSSLSSSSQSAEPWVQTHWPCTLNDNDVSIKNNL